MRSTVQLSGALGVTKTALKRVGVLDSYAGIDSRLHVHPALLRTTKVPELNGALDTFNRYFEDVLRMIIRAKSGGSIERQAKKRLVFPEVNEAALGFSDQSSRGRGVSPKMAARLFITASEIIEAGIEDPAIFELVMLFEDGFGPDLISDLTICVILNHLSQFNARVCGKLGIETKQKPVKGFGVAEMAYSKSLNRCFLLIPKSILTDLPEATCREDIDSIAMYNESVRMELNKMLGENWRDVARKLGKQGLRRLLFKHPEMFQELINRYKVKRPDSYDFENDPLGEFIWDDLAEAFTQSAKLALSPPTDRNQLVAVVRKTCLQFKRLVENNGLCDHLYDGDGRHRPEKFSQLLYFGIADCYCEANGLDLSREPNAGRGPVDFKLSRGNDRVLVEVKLSSNRKGLEGLLLQLPEYAKAESSIHDILLMVVISANRNVVDDLQSAYNLHRSKGIPVPELIIVEAFEAHDAPSASKLSF
jgi:hypothetical protein